MSEPPRGPRAPEPARVAARPAGARPAASRRVLAWLNHRTGYGALVKVVTDEPIPGGARWWYTSGALLTFLLLVQGVTGVLLAAHYAPTTAGAWASTAFIQDTLTMGWFIRGLHNLGSSAMLVLCALHAVQVLLFGAYRAPREMTWIVGLGLGGLVLAFALSGTGLPWDESGYWEKAIREQHRRRPAAYRRRPATRPARGRRLRQLHPDAPVRRARPGAAGRDGAAVRRAPGAGPPARHHAALGLRRDRARAAHANLLAEPSGARRAGVHGPVRDADAAGGAHARRVVGRSRRSRRRLPRAPALVRAAVVRDPARAGAVAGAHRHRGGSRRCWRWRCWRCRGSTAVARAPPSIAYRCSWAPPWARPD